MQVKLLQSMAGAERSWSIGDAYECVDADEAGRLIEAGIAEPIGDKIETATAPSGKKRGGS